MDKDKHFVERPAHYYPVWSNFLFFLAGLYALAVPYRLFVLLPFASWLSTRHRTTTIAMMVAFVVYGLLILLTGVFSIVYHVHTPSWTLQRTPPGQSEAEADDDYLRWLEVDSAFALTITIYGICLLSVIWVLKWKYITLDFLIHEPTAWFSVLFIALSAIFYSLGTQSTRNAFECVHQDPETGHCYRRHIDGYDIFHSNWHIFVGLTLIFWITLCVRMYSVDGGS